MGMADPVLIAGMIVRNEADRYLPMVLSDLATYCDRIVVLDDGSTDGTPEVCRSFAKVVFHRRETSLFWQNESVLRIQLWDLVVAEGPEWILAIDADEMLEPRFRQEKRRLLTQTAHDVLAMRLYEFWNSMTHYRVDKLWNPAGRITPMLVRHRPGARYAWRNQPLHCGRIPVGLAEPYYCGLRCKHFGYARAEDHRRKYELYVSHDPQGRFTPLSHYQSILDQNAVLAEWRD